VGVKAFDLSAGRGSRTVQDWNHESSSLQTEMTCCLPDSLLGLLLAGQGRSVQGGTFCPTNASMAMIVLEALIVGSWT